MLTDRELIDAAVAAGAVRHIPMGVQLTSAGGPRAAVRSPFDSTIALALANALREKPGSTAKQAMDRVWRSRYMPGGLIGLDRQHADNLLRVLLHHGWARQQGDRWYLTDDAPVPSKEVVRERVARRGGALTQSKGRP